MPLALMDDQESLDRVDSMEPPGKRAELDKTRTALSASRSLSPFFVVLLQSSSELMASVETIVRQAGQGRLEVTVGQARTVAMGRKAGTAKRVRMVPGRRTSA